MSHSKANGHILQPDETEAIPLDESDRYLIHDALTEFTTEEDAELAQEYCIQLAAYVKPE